MALEQAISGYNDPQYPAQYTNAKSQLVSLFNDMNLRLARAETTITRNNTARAKRNQAKLAVTLLNVDAKHPGIIS